MAEPIEEAVNGLNNEIYASSTSANDGSYNLTVSFKVGSDPDIDNVNVTNAVQQATSQLPAQVQQEGITVRKRSSAILQFLFLSSQGNKLTPLQISNYAIINLLDPIGRVPGVGQALAFGTQNYSMRIWYDTNRLTQLSLTPGDIIAALQAQNIQAPVGTIGAPPEQQRPAAADDGGNARPAADSGAVRRHRDPRQSGRHRPATQRHRPRRARRPDPVPHQQDQQGCRPRHRHLPRPRRQRRRHLRRDHTGSGETATRLPAQPAGHDRLR